MFCESTLLNAGRYEDVTNPPEWVSSPVVATEADFAARRRTLTGPDLIATAFDGVQFDRQQLYVIHYWHVKARKSIPRKPDGLSVCVHCCRNIAAHRCITCAADYCLACHRGTHSNPFGFHQHAKATKEQYSDPGNLCEFFVCVVDPRNCNKNSLQCIANCPAFYIYQTTSYDSCRFPLNDPLSLLPAQPFCSSWPSTRTLSLYPNLGAVRCAKAPRCAREFTATTAKWIYVTPVAAGTSAKTARYSYLLTNNFTNVFFIFPSRIHEHASKQAHSYYSI